MYDKTSYNELMTMAISVRLDDEAQRALAQLEASGLSRSEAIRSSLVASAQQARNRDALRREMAALEADEDDRREMLEVAEFMELLRAEG
jgi:Arc/MetJ-type ribon-helix-helix transcriptional regulator